MSNSHYSRRSPTRRTLDAAASMDKTSGYGILGSKDGRPAWPRHLLNLSLTSSIERPKERPDLPTVLEHSRRRLHPLAAQSSVATGWMARPWPRPLRLASRRRAPAAPPASHHHLLSSSSSVRYCTARHPTYPRRRPATPPRPPWTTLIVRYPFRTFLPSIDRTNRTTFTSRCSWARKSLAFATVLARTRPFPPRAPWSRCPHGTFSISEKQSQARVCVATQGNRDRKLMLEDDVEQCASKVLDEMS